MKHGQMILRYWLVLYAMLRVECLELVMALELTTLTIAEEMTRTLDEVIRRDTGIAMPVGYKILPSIQAISCLC